MGTSNLNINADNVTVVDYCRNRVGYPIPDDAIYMLLLDRGLKVTTPIEEVDKKTKELLLADMYIYCMSMPSTSSQVKDSDGDWSHSEGGMRITADDKKLLKRMANDIYEKYGEKPIGNSKFKILSDGIGNKKIPLL